MCVLGWDQQTSTEFVRERFLKYVANKLIV